MLDDMEAVQAMSYPCSNFLAAARLQDHFANLCENAGLTYLLSHQVPQYSKLTYYFVNWFKFNDGASPTIEFRYCEDTLTMTLATFCGILGVQMTRGYPHNSSA